MTEICFTPMLSGNARIGTDCSDAFASDRTDLDGPLAGGVGGTAMSQQ